MTLVKLTFDRNDLSEIASTELLNRFSSMQDTLESASSLQKTKNSNFQEEVENFGLEKQVMKKYKSLIHKRKCMLNKQK